MTLAGERRINNVSDDARASATGGTARRRNDNSPRGLVGRIEEVAALRRGSAILGRCDNPLRAIRLRQKSDALIRGTRRDRILADDCIPVLPRDVDVAGIEVVGNEKRRIAGFAGCRARPAREGSEQKEKNGKVAHREFSCRK
jgi:hypothetical protein